MSNHFDGVNKMVPLTDEQQAAFWLHYAKWNEIEEHKGVLLAKDRNVLRASRRYLAMPDCWHEPVVCHRGQLWGWVGANGQQRAKRVAERLAGHIGRMFYAPDKSQRELDLEVSQ